MITGKRITGHESIRNELPGLETDQAVIKDGKIITSRGAGTAIEFGLSLVNLLCGKEKEEEIRVSIHA
jgi:4-methyl-5(b-hydroxyethyl)-thiazole monophosphate biosynthesis